MVWILSLNPSPIDLKYSAERAVLHSDFCKSFDLYKSYFDKSQNVLFRDVHNFYQVAMMCKDSSKVSYALNKLKSYRLSSKYYGDEICSKLNYVSSDSKVVGFIDSLFLLDQGIREECKKISLNYYGVCEDTIKEIDKENVRLLDSFLISNSFPSDMDLSSINPTSKNSIFFIAEHNLTWGNTNLMDNLYSACIAGSYDSQLYAYLMEYYNSSYLKSSSSMYGLSSIILINNQLYIFPLDSEELKKEVDFQRKIIGLDTYDEFIEKVKYQYKSKKKSIYFINPTLFRNFVFSGEELKQIQEN